MATISIVSWSFLLAVLLSLLPAAFSVSLSYPNQHHCNHVRSLNFTLYNHGTYNKTDFMIYPGVGTNMTDIFVIPFGSMFVIDSPMKRTPDPNSTVVGRLQSFAVSAALDGLTNMSIVKMTLDLKQPHKLKGSLSLAGFGGNNYAPDNAILGGTGDFLFVQGYCVYTHLSTHDLSYVNKFDFYLFWPPYAPQEAIKAF